MKNAEATQLPAVDLAAAERAQAWIAPAGQKVDAAGNRARALLALTVLRCLFGACMGLGAWYWAEHFDAYVVAQLLLGGLAIAVSLGVARGRGLRGVLALIAFVGFFLPFLFDVRDTQIYNAVIVDKALLLAAIVSPDIFSS